VRSLIALLAAVVLLSTFQGADAEEAKAALLAKGFSEETLGVMNPLCLRSLDQRVPPRALWYATFDRASRTLTVDFQASDKVHHSFLFTSVGEDRCEIYHVAVYVIEKDFKNEARDWLRTFKEKGIEVEVAEETPQRIYVVGRGNSGIKLFLYPMGKYTLGIFRNFQALTATTRPSPQAKEGSP